MTTLQLLQKNVQDTFRVIISLHKTHNKGINDIHQAYYTTKTT